MKNILAVAFIVCSFFNSSAFSDTFFFRNGQTFSGELLVVTDSVLIIETVLIKSGKLQNISVSRDSISTVIDESGKSIYSSEVQVDDLEKYYSNRHEDVEFVPVDRFHLKSGNVFLGKLYSKDGNSFFIKKILSGGETKFVSLKISDILKHEKNYTYQIKKRPQSVRKYMGRVSSYPTLAANLGFSVAKTNFRQIQNQIQNLYDTNDSLKHAGLQAGDIFNFYFGLNFQMALIFTKSFSVEADGIYFPNSKDFSFYLFSGKIKYQAYFGVFKPWVAVGYSFMSIEAIQKVDRIISEYGYHRYTLKSINWKSSAKGLSTGLGLDVGKDVGAGISLSLSCLPFPDKYTEYKVNSGGLSLVGESSKKIDLSVLYFSVGLRYIY